MSHSVRMLGLLVTQSYSTPSESAASLLADPEFWPPCTPPLEQRRGARSRSLSFIIYHTLHPPHLTSLLPSASAMVFSRALFALSAFLLAGLAMVQGSSRERHTSPRLHKC